MELLPQSSEPDPHWRYLLFGRFVEIHVMAFRRASASAALLDQSGEGARLINYGGAYPVSARFYQATARLCAAVQRAPEKYISAGGSWNALPSVRLAVRTAILMWRELG